MTDERPHLPVGWAWATLGDMLEDIEAGKNFRCVERSPQGDEVGVMKVSAVTWGEYDETESKTCTDAKRFNQQLLVRPNDFLFSRANTLELVGACVIAKRVTKGVMLSDKILRLRFLGVLQEWVLWALRSRHGRREIESLATGNQLSMRNISQENIRRIQIPLAPLGEQHRIVDAIEEHFTRLDAGVASLRRVQAALKRYRAAVLKAAVEGKLTEAWRAEHPDVEPASRLVERILVERRQHWEADPRAKGKDPKKVWYEAQVEVDASGLPSLPGLWTWAPIGQLGQVQLGRQRAPQYHTGNYMRPYLRVANVFEDRIDTADILYMNFTPEEFDVYRLQCGDILLNEGQSLELVGRPAMYRDEVPGACFQNTLVRFRASQGVLAEYALIVFRAYLHTKRFQRIGRHTVNIAHLGAGRFAALEFPLPPLVEQKQIVAEVERRLSIVREVEATVEANLKRADRLRRAVLQEAFAGRLVPQDPSDEPASVLLERICQEREVARSGRTGKRREPGPELVGQTAVASPATTRQDSLW